MLTPDQLKGAIYALALAHGYSDCGYIGEQLDANGADLVSQECFISLNDTASDILARSTVAGPYDNTNRIFFMSLSPSYRVWHYSPNSDTLQEMQRDEVVAEIVRGSKFPDVK